MSPADRVDIYKNHAQEIKMLMILSFECNCRTFRGLGQTNQREINVSERFFIVNKEKSFHCINPNRTNAVGLFVMQKHCILIKDSLPSRQLRKWAMFVEYAQHI